MTPYTRNFNQVATYWAATTPDGFGGFNFSAPVLLACRWQDKRDLVRNADGDEVVCMSIVYVDRQLARKGWLVLGDMTGNPNPTPPDAQEIVALGSSPSLDATKVLFKVWL